MENMNGLDAADKILSTHKDAAILFLTTFSDEEYIVKALKLGVRGYLLKQDYKALPAAIHAAIDGQSVFGGAIVNKLPTLMSAKSSNSFDYKKYEITEKEFEVMQLVSDGFSNKEISQKLFQRKRFPRVMQTKHSTFNCSRKGKSLQNPICRGFSKDSVRASISLIQRMRN